MAAAHQDAGLQGPSWADVSEYLRHIMEQTEWAVTFECSVPPDTRGVPSRGLWVRVVARRQVGTSGLYAEIAAGDRWPTSQHRTMPGLLFRLAAELERKLEDTVADALTGLPLGSYTCPPALSHTDPSRTKNGA